MTFSDWPVQTRRGPMWLGFRPGAVFFTDRHPETGEPAEMAAAVFEATTFWRHDLWTDKDEAHLQWLKREGIL